MIRTIYICYDCMDQLDRHLRQGGGLEMVIILNRVQRFSM
jgi:hypothetical protein